MMIQDQDTYTKELNKVYDYYLKKIGESTYWVWKQKREESIKDATKLNLCEMKIIMTFIQTPPLSSALNTSGSKVETKAILQPLFFFIVDNLKYKMDSLSSFPTIHIGSNTQEESETNPIVKAYREYIASYYHK